MKVQIVKPLIVTLLLLSALFSGCDKDSPDPQTDPNIPQPENDSKSGGVYKGVLVGSSGTFKLILQQGSISATMTFDGTSKILTTTMLNSWSSGQPISNAVFTKDDWQLTFSVGADGGNPQIGVNIPGHSVQAVIQKESSAVSVLVFEGTYSGDASGAFNFIIKGNAVSGVSSSNDGFGNSSITGTINGNSLSGVLSNGATITGTRNNDSVSGSWSQEVNGQGTFSGTWTGTKKM